MRGAARGDVGALADVGADGEEGGVEAVLSIASTTLVTLLFSSSVTPSAEDPLDLRVEHVARQPVLRDPEAHHPAGHRPGLADRHGVPEPRQEIGGREARWPGADDEHPLARGLGVRLDPPAPLDPLVADEALDRVDPHRLVELAAVAGRLARVVADPAHDRRERVVLHDLAPGALVALAALLGVVEPLLDVLPGRAGVIAGRQPVE